MKESIVGRVRRLEGTLSRASAIEYDGFWEALGVDHEGLLAIKKDFPNEDIAMMALNVIAENTWKDGPPWDDSKENWYGVQEDEDRHEDRHEVVDFEEKQPQQERNGVWPIRW